MWMQDVSLRGGRTGVVSETTDFSRRGLERWRSGKRAGPVGGGRDDLKWVT